MIADDAEKGLSGIKASGPSSRIPIEGANHTVTSESIAKDNQKSCSEIKSLQTDMSRESLREKFGLKWEEPASSPKPESYLKNLENEFGVSAATSNPSAFNLSSPKYCSNTDDLAVPWNYDACTGPDQPSCSYKSSPYVEESHSYLYNTPGHDTSRGPHSSSKKAKKSRKSSFSFELTEGNETVTVTNDVPYKGKGKGKGKKSKKSTQQYDITNSFSFADKSHTNQRDTNGSNVNENTDEVAQKSESDTFKSCSYFRRLLGFTSKEPADSSVAMGPTVQSNDGDNVALEKPNGRKRPYHAALSSPTVGVTPITPVVPVRKDHQAIITDDEDDDDSPDHTKKGSDETQKPSYQFDDNASFYSAVGSPCNAQDLMTPNRDDITQDKTDTAPNTHVYVQQSVFTGAFKENISSNDQIAARIDNPNTYVTESALTGSSKETKARTTQLDSDDILSDDQDEIVESPCSVFDLTSPTRADITDDESINSPNNHSDVEKESAITIESNDTVVVVDNVSDDSSNDMIYDQDTLINSPCNIIDLTSLSSDDILQDDTIMAQDHVDQDFSLTKSLTRDDVTLNDTVMTVDSIETADHACNSRDSVINDMPIELTSVMTENDSRSCAENESILNHACSPNYLDCNDNDGKSDDQDMEYKSPRSESEMPYDLMIQDYADTASNADIHMEQESASTGDSMETEDHASKTQGTVTIDAIEKMQVEDTESPSEVAVVILPIQELQAVSEYTKEDDNMDTNDGNNIENETGKKIDSEDHNGNTNNNESTRNVENSVGTGPVCNKSENNNNFYRDPNHKSSEPAENILEEIKLPSEVNKKCVTAGGIGVLDASESQNEPEIKWFAGKNKATVGFRSKRAYVECLQKELGVKPDSEQVLFAPINKVKVIGDVNVPLQKSLSSESILSEHNVVQVCYPVRDDSIISDDIVASETNTEFMDHKLIEINPSAIPLPLDADVGLDDEEQNDGDKNEVAGSPFELIKHKSLEGDFVFQVDPAVLLIPIPSEVSSSEVDNAHLNSNEHHEANLQRKQISREDDIGNIEGIMKTSCETDTQKESSTVSVTKQKVLKVVVTPYDFKGKTIKRRRNSMVFPDSEDESVNEEELKDSVTEFYTKTTKHNHRKRGISDPSSCGNKNEDNITSFSPKPSVDLIRKKLYHVSNKKPSIKSGKSLEFKNVSQKIIKDNFEEEENNSHSESSERPSQVKDSHEKVEKIKSFSRNLDEGRISEKHKHKRPSYDRIETEISETSKQLTDKHTQWVVPHAKPKKCGDRARDDAYTERNILKIKRNRSKSLDERPNEMKREEIKSKDHKKPSQTKLFIVGEWGDKKDSQCKGIKIGELVDKKYSHSKEIKPKQKFVPEEDSINSQSSIWSSHLNTQNDCKIKCIRRARSNTVDVPVPVTEDLEVVKSHNIDSSKSNKKCEKRSRRCASTGDAFIEKWCKEAESLLVAHHTPIANTEPSKNKQLPDPPKLKSILKPSSYGTVMESTRYPTISAISSRIAARRLSTRKVTFQLDPESSQSECSFKMNKLPKDAATFHRRTRSKGGLIKEKVETNKSRESKEVKSIEKLESHSTSEFKLPYSEKIQVNESTSKPRPIFRPTLKAIGPRRKSIENLSGEIPVMLSPDSRVNKDNFRSGKLSNENIKPTTKINRGKEKRTSGKSIEALRSADDKIELFSDESNLTDSNYEWTVRNTIPDKAKDETQNNSSKIIMKFKRRLSLDERHLKNPLRMRDPDNIPTGNITMLPKSSIEENKKQNYTSKNDETNSVTDDNTEKIEDTHCDSIKNKALNNTFRPKRPRSKSIDERTTSCDQYLSMLFTPDVVLPISKAKAKAWVVTQREVDRMNVISSLQSYNESEKEVAVSQTGTTSTKADESLNINNSKKDHNTLTEQSFKADDKNSFRLPLTRSQSKNVVKHTKDGNTGINKCRTLNTLQKKEQIQDSEENSSKINFPNLDPKFKIPKKNTKESYMATATSSTNMGKSISKIGVQGTTIKDLGPNVNTGEDKSIIVIEKKSAIRWNVPQRTQNVLDLDKIEAAMGTDKKKNTKKPGGKKSPNQGTFVRCGGEVTSYGASAKFKRKLARHLDVHGALCNYDPEDEKKRGWLTAIVIIFSSNACPFKRWANYYACLYCNEKFLRMSGLETHTLKHELTHDIIVDVIGSQKQKIKVNFTNFSCKRCIFTAADYFELKEHIKFKHVSKLNLCSDGIYPFKIDNNEYLCIVCFQSFNNYTILERHVNIHYPRYDCKVCGLSFVSIVERRGHVLSTHTPVYPCDVCKKEFATVEAMREHVEAVHNQPTSFKCLYCDDEFKEDRLRVNHMMRVHGVKTPGYRYI